MASEVEAKWWLEKPQDSRIVQILGLESIVAYNIEQIRANARKISGSEPEFFDYFDRFFIKKNLSTGYSAQDLDKKLRLEDGKIRYGDKSIVVSVKSGNDLRTDYNGFIKALTSFFSGEDNDPTATEKYQIRLREDRVTGKLSFTLKVKHGVADEKTEEYEFFVDSEESVRGFLETLGYELRPDKSKVKKGERYSFHRKGFKIDVDFNDIEYPPGAKILEIETTPPILDNARINFVYDIARELGIQHPHLDTKQGGNLENRFYQQLKKLISR